MSKSQTQKIILAATILLMLLFAGLNQFSLSDQGTNFFVKQSTYVRWLSLFPGISAFLTLILFVFFLLAVWKTPRSPDDVDLVRRSIILLWGIFLFILTALCLCSWSLWTFGNPPTW